MKASEAQAEQGKERSGGREPLRGIKLCFSVFVLSSLEHQNKVNATLGGTGEEDNEECSESSLANIASDQPTLTLRGFRASTVFEAVTQKNIQPYSAASSQKKCTLRSGSFPAIPRLRLASFNDKKAAATAGGGAATKQEGIASL